MFTTVREKYYNVFGLMYETVDYINSKQLYHWINK